jgi:outer membrane receptor protein involved in Fe transport
MKVRHNAYHLLLTATTIFSLVSSSLTAGTTGKISGTVTDASTGEGLAGANVMVAGTIFGASTDETGYYFIININPGTYEVSVAYIGYETNTSSNVRVSVDQTTNLGFQLSTSVIEGSEVNVTAERAIIEPDVTGSKSILTSEFLENTAIIDLEDALSQQTGFADMGETQYIRGGLANEVSYIVDGVSMVSGILGDSWSRLNTTSMEEVEILTGGYNAEYGNAMSGVINIVSKEAAAGSGVHGNVRVRHRPAGVYHWGDHIYSEDLWYRTNYPLSHWESELQSETKATGFATYMGLWYPDQWDGTTVPTAQQLLDTYNSQVTPDPVLGDYDKRAENEIEATVYGSPSSKLNYLISFRTKKGVNIFPQGGEYNPERNIQLKLNYYLSDKQKLSLDVMNGGYTSYTYTESNWNNRESSKEAAWQPNADVRHPYDGKALAPWGGYWHKGPQTKDIQMFSLKYQNTVSPSTFYTVQVSSLSDNMKEEQDYDRFKTTTDQMPWGGSMFDLAGNFRVEARQIQVNNYTESASTTAKFDLTSQFSKTHQIKGGAELVLSTLDYQHYYMEFAAGDVWHLDNVYDAKPTEISAYFQDKMEFAGMIVNIGVRFDGFNANHKYSENIFDPVGFQTWSGGVNGQPSNTEPIWQSYMDKKDWFAVLPGVTQDYLSAFDGVRNNGQTVASELKTAISPRLGFSFPITEKSKLRFNYGHFYQRPNWSKILGFPTSWYDSDPFGSVRMDQWQGWYGQPGVTYERTIQYEIGYDLNFADVWRVSSAFYYKDGSRLNRWNHTSTYNRGGGGMNANSWGVTAFRDNYSRSRNIAGDGHDNIFYTNNGYKDTRGIEIGVDKLYANNWSLTLNYNYSLSSGGLAGYAWYYEDASRASAPHSFDEIKATWLSNSMMKTSLNYTTPKSLGSVNFGLFNEYYSGAEYTYYADDFTGLRTPNNKRWFPHKRTDLKVSKSFQLGTFAPSLAVEIINLLDNYDLIIPSGDNLKAWEEDGTIPKVGKSGEDDVWNFRNSISNPRRMIYLSLNVDF